MRQIELFNHLTVYKKWFLACLKRYPHTIHVQIIYIWGVYNIYTLFMQFLKSFCTLLYDIKYFYKIQMTKMYLSYRWELK